MLKRVNAILYTLLCFTKHCILMTENILYENLQKPSI